MDDRVPTELWVTAHMRTCSAQGIPAYVVHKGALAAGTVAVKIVMGAKGCRLFNQMRDVEGTMGWMQVFDEDIVDEKKADEYIRRSISRDPDMWVIEIEDHEGKNPFEGKVL